MPDKPILQVVTKLLQRTMAGGVQWNSTGNDHSFMTVFPENTIQISELVSDYDDSLSYLLRIFDADGKVVEEVDEVSLAMEGMNQHLASRQLRDLFAGARRTARGANRAIQTILKALDHPPDPNRPS